ncbi:probable G-protein coupled receptor 160 [Brienomyrus brachyistius]|uniref:probable G-protein coupled receptor 160 n=1 Tax=Brienomyrus brachyistius TaxID=42636 RepID=UPI0020B1C87D|nr:probable G-protein coupled receptor 160 [Brienomyrus brachyistius]
MQVAHPAEVMEYMTPGGTMQNDIYSLVLVLNGKCLLNWAVVGLQRRHMGQSLLGLLCVSLALVDTFLAAGTSAIYLLEDVSVLSLRLTSHHICLLVQTACFTYGLMHWPVFFIIGLDHFWNLSHRPRPLHWARKLGYAVGVGLMWTTALLYVTLVSQFYLEVQEEPYLLLSSCQVFQSPQSTQVSVVLLITLACALINSVPGFQAPVFTEIKVPPGHIGSVLVEPQCMSPRAILSRKQVLGLILHGFLSTWAPYVLLQAAVLVLRVNIPAYMDLNVPWLCFLNSFLISVALWGYTRDLCHEERVMFTDGFCHWDFFSGFPDIDGHRSEGQTCVNVSSLKGISALH